MKQSMRELPWRRMAKLGLPAGAVLGLFASVIPGFQGTWEFALWGLVYVAWAVVFVMYGLARPFVEPFVTALLSGLASGIVSAALFPLYLKNSSYSGGALDDAGFFVVMVTLLFVSLLLSALTGALFAMIFFVRDRVQKESS